MSTPRVPQHPDRTWATDQANRARIAREKEQLELLRQILAELKTISKQLRTRLPDRPDFT
jgi:hypothetical protein